MSIGPPMYFVVKGGLNYSDTKTQNLICSGQYCNSDSVTTQIFTASQQPNTYVILISPKYYFVTTFLFFFKLILFSRSYIAKPASSWLDDYFDWSILPSCCKMTISNDSFCPHNSMYTVIYISRNIEILIYNFFFFLFAQVTRQIVNLAISQ